MWKRLKLSTGLGTRVLALGQDRLGRESWDAWSARGPSSDWLRWDDRVMFRESPSTFLFQPVWSLHACGQQSHHPPPESGGLVPAEQLKDVHQIIIYIPSGGTRGPVTLDLISNCSSLLFGTQGRPKRRKLVFFYKQERGDMQRLLYLGRCLRVLLVFNPPFSLMLPNLKGNGGAIRKDIKLWMERWIINSAGKLSFRRTWFPQCILKMLKQEFPLGLSSNEPD